MQLTINITEEQAAELERLSASRHTSRDELVENVLAGYIAEHHSDEDDDLLPFFGMMKGKIEDGLIFQERLREEWVREWDPEYTAETR